MPCSAGVCLEAGPKKRLSHDKARNSQAQKQWASRARRGDWAPSCLAPGRLRHQAIKRLAPSVHRQETLSDDRTDAGRRRTYGGEYGGGGGRGWWVSWVAGRVKKGK